MTIQIQFSFKAHEEKYLNHILGTGMPVKDFLIAAAKAHQDGRFRVGRVSTGASTSAWDYIPDGDTREVLDR